MLRNVLCRWTGAARVTAGAGNTMAATRVSVFAPAGGRALSVLGAAGQAQQHIGNMRINVGPSMRGTFCVSSFF